ncbi:MAG: hypothetical protein OXG99_02380 [Alphaproteobacteria bacterium]|nr:hypothetical protein [Alphaproteobacteria bacterium]
MRSSNILSMSARAKAPICVAVAGVFAIGACATKQFEEMPPLDASKLRAMSCEDIEQEFLMLQRHERGVDEEATSGQVEQMLWGGVWSVMADEKLEHVARQKIRDRERQLYEARLKKECP